MRHVLPALVVALWWSGPALAQQCLHGTGETAGEAARQRDALAATRAINTIEINQPSARQRVFLTHEQLAGAPAAASLQQSPNPALRRLALGPDEEILPGWKLTLEVSPTGYWFMIRDTTDPCGFAFISNHSGLIYRAEPLR